MRVRWTDDMVDFLRKNYQHYPNKELVEIFEKKFGVPFTIDKLKNAKKSFKIGGKTYPNKGRFYKGMIPWNKGKTMGEETRKKLERTWFKKGRSYYLNAKPLGSTRVDTNGYKVIKLAKSGKWKLFSRYMYEKYHNVELKDDEVIIFADRNKDNFDKDNLVKVNRKELLYLNENKLIFEDKDLTKSGVVVSKMEIAINERRKNLK